MAQRPGELRPRLRPPASVETSNRTGSMSEETSLSGSPEWIPRTRVHCMVKEETFGRMAHPTPYPGPPSIWAAWSRHWSHLKTDISDRSLLGGFVRRCRSWSGKSRQYVGPIQFVLDPNKRHLCVWSTHTTLVYLTFGPHMVNETSPDPCSAPPVLTLRRARFRCHVPSPGRWSDPLDAGGVVLVWGRSSTMRPGQRSRCRIINVEGKRLQHDANLEA